MELHSYAKRRASKKWTIDQKRKLVEARITHDAWFNNKPTNSVVPWKKVLSVAKLDDFNVFFVRKQWSNMVARYKQYKQTRLGNVTTKAIDADMIRKISNEWEFFQPIHQFMTRKTTNLHSYALTKREENERVEGNEELEGVEDIKQSPETQSQDFNQHLGPCHKEHTRPQIHLQASTSSNERINVFSSDTNEDYAIADSSVRSDAANFDRSAMRNTDHDFYSKKTADEQQQQQLLNYFADASEDTQESMKIEVSTSATATTTTTFTTTTTTARHLPVRTDASSSHPNQFIFLEENAVLGEEPEIVEAIPKTTTTTSKIQVKQEFALASASASASDSLQSVDKGNIKSQSQQKANSSKLTEREKYYRHKRRFHHRLERRFDSILQVVGQIVKAEYPSIDVGPIMGPAAAAAAATNSLSFNKFLSSSDEDEGDSDSVENAYESTACNDPSGNMRHHDS